MTQRDLNLTYGATYETSFTLYSDPRLKKWRGEFKEWYVYKKGEGTEWEGLAYVATLEVQHSTPGEPGEEAFWSPLARLILTGYKVLFNIEGVYQYEPTVNATEGEVNIEVAPSHFVTAPSSAHYYVQLTTPGGKVSYPVGGTALFKSP